MSAVYTYDDVIEAVRERLDDATQARLTDEEILAFHVPRALQALYNERPDVFIGVFSTLAMKPTDQSALVQIDDTGFPDLVERILQTVAARKPEVSDPVARPKGPPHSDAGEVPPSVTIQPAPEKPKAARPPVPPKV